MILAYGFREKQQQLGATVAPTTQNSLLLGFSLLLANTDTAKLATHGTNN